jgi:hypothetical protein
MDVGESINPAIDIGQVEGGYMQGYGLYTLEELRFSPQGFLLTKGPGMYKLPGFGDIPAEFNVALLRGAPNKKAVFSSKVCTPENTDITLCCNSKLLRHNINICGSPYCQFKCRLLENHRSSLQLLSSTLLKMQSELLGSKAESLAPFASTHLQPLNEFEWHVRIGLRKR